jgi:hypothetical protein
MGMDQKRFDNLTRTLASGSSRRKVLGGALAGVIGAGIAAVSGTAAKGKKNRKKGNGRAGAEFTCTANNANDPNLGGCSDNQSCCASTAGGLGPICVTEGTQRSGTQQFCGDKNDGSGVCRTCPPGTVCSEDADNEIRCICTPSTCPTGCCINNDLTDEDDECVQNGSGAPVNSVNPDFDGNSVCGFGGSECTICSIGTIFAGCCTPTGACNAGTTGISCGSGGNICEPCPAGSNCINQTCETTAPCGPATCGAGCCSGQACLSGTSNGACGEGGGACQVCGAGSTCVNHQCVAQPTCPPGLTDCNGICVNLQVDKANCGACGNACGGSQRCRGGVCKKKMMMMMN